MKTSVILAVRDGISYTKQCIYAMRAHLGRESCEIIVIDNGSTDGSYEWLLLQPDIRLVRNDTDLGRAAAWNQGIRQAKGDSILFLQNYVVLSKHAVERMREVLWSREDIGAVAPYTNFCHGPWQSISGLSYNTMEGVQDVADQVEQNIPYDLPNLCLDAYCIMTKRQALMAAGTFKEEYANLSLGVVDFSLRLLSKGYFPVLANTYVHSEPNGASVESEPSQESLEFFYKNWNFFPGYSMNVRRELLSYIEAEREGLCILDVGCSCGGNLMWLKYHNPEAELYGIELNPSAASVANFFGHVEARDVEDFVREEWREKFDWIIMGDVLEHLRDPWKALKTMTEYLKPEGKAIICIPNINHISILRGLLNGRWQYAGGGILDRTHLRFFTRQTFEDCMRDAGLHSIHTDYNTAAGVVCDSFLEELCKMDGVSVTKEELLAFQWIFVAQKDPV